MNTRDTQPALPDFITKQAIPVRPCHLHLLRPHSSSEKLIFRVHATIALWCVFLWHITYQPYENGNISLNIWIYLEFCIWQ